MEYCEGRLSSKQWETNKQKTLICCHQHVIQGDNNYIRIRKQSNQHKVMVNQRLITVSYYLIITCTCTCAQLHVQCHVHVTCARTRDWWQTVFQQH